MPDLSAITKFLHSRIMVKRSTVDGRMWADLQKNGESHNYMRHHVRGMAMDIVQAVIEKQRGIINSVKVDHNEREDRHIIELELLVLTRGEIAALIGLIMGSVPEYAPNPRHPPGEDERAKYERMKMAQTLMEADALHRRGEEPTYKPNPDVKRPDFLNEGDTRGIQSIGNARGR